MGEAREVIETIFKGATRPPMKFGVPLVPLVVLLLPGFVSGMWLSTMVSWRFAPRRSATPWIGLGVGYERLDLFYAEAGSAIDLVANGGTLGLHAGFDVRMSERLRVGPVVSGTFGRYTTIALDGVASRDFEPAVHGWIVFALRATFEP